MSSHGSFGESGNDRVTWMTFTCTKLAIAAISCRHVSICLSQVGVLLKQLNVGSHKQRHTKALEF